MTSPASAPALADAPSRLPLLRATYRVQLNARFTLRQLRDVVPYLERLGVSHVYCSPLLAARAGSMHGYDVTDPTRLNPELGGAEDLQGLAADLHERGMGLLLDIVPNHMSASAENPFWMDVLARGERSRWAHWFDIDWNAPGADGKVILPVLGGALDEVISRGELRVVLEEQHGSARLAYFHHRYPLRADALPPQLQLAELDPAAFEFNRGELGALVAAQHYMLLGWREAAARVNYRRFFDVNDLVALRMEDASVFDATHATILDWVGHGLVDGLRVDHVDGLRDPLAYLTRLRTAVHERLESRGATAAAFPIFVEKILGDGEVLRRDWPVQGTTGYEFLNDAEELFMDPAGFARIERGYRGMRRLPADYGFAAVARAGKCRALQSGLAADLDRVVRATPGVEQSAVAELIASFDVYRTYIDARTVDAPAPDDAAVLDAAAARARSDAARELGRGMAHPRHTAARVEPPHRLEFVQRFQQLSGPAAARGIEDTALYDYFPLASRSEVGASPDRDLSSAVARFHAGNADRAAHWPLNLLCTDTHDTKRGADVRARLDAVSECPDEWLRSVRRWRRLNARHRATVGGRLAPDTNAEYLLYQTLVGLWPAPRPGRRVDDLPDAAWRDALRPRLHQYMLKAAREAKVRTTWTEPNAAYEKALADFIDAVLVPGADAPFLTDVARLVARIADAAFWIGAARTLFQFTSPGTPDVYQGTELASATLVDPDNRRAVDFDGRVSLLERADADAAASPRTVAPERADARLLLTRTLLSARREHAELFSRGAYVPLTVEGPRCAHVVAFARAHQGQLAIVAAARLLGSQARTPCDPAWWADTHLLMPTEIHAAQARVQWHDWLASRGATAMPSPVVGVPIASLFSDVPLALLTGR